MDRRNWLWRRKSLEKSPGDTESSGSASSLSERYSDDQEVLMASPNHAQSSDVSSNISGSEVHETVKSLTEKLSAALMNVSAKENLVKQHMQVAEEAVLGWEKTETELATLKQQLEAATMKNYALEDRIGHLDGALKESVKQLRLSREDQEQKAHDLLMKKTREWESDKFELENRLIEVQLQLEVSKAEGVDVDHDLRSKLEATEKENMALKLELLIRSEELQVQTLEKELSTRAAETASKQHLVSIKKVAKLEAECRRLGSVARRKTSAVTDSVCVESLTDSHSDNGERLRGVHNEPSCSDSWASALIAELDHFKNEKVSVRNLATSSIEIDLMDDFLEMEKLVEMPQADHGSSNFELELDTACSPLKVELEALRQRTTELEEKVEKMETEKAELEAALADTRNKLELSCNQLTVAEDQLVVLQRYLDFANDSNQVVMTEVVTVEEKGKVLESRLESAQSEVGELREEVCILEGKVEKEKAVSAEFEAKVEVMEATREALERHLVSANSKVKKLHHKVDILEGQVAEERAVAAGFGAKVEAIEAKRKELELELESAHLEVGKLCEKVVSLEVEVEVARRALETHLRSAHEEVGKMHYKVGLLEEKVETEKALSAQLAAKCQNLEGDLSRKKREAELRQAPTSNGELKIKQEEELAVAAGKLAECQKTIASLGQQLKSLTSLDDFMIEDEKAGLNGGSQCHRKWGCREIAQ